MANEPIWKSTVDKETWSAEVNQTSDYAGVLTVTEVATGTVVHSSPVGISYGAIFGPDVADVYEWQETAINVIDNPEKRSIA